MKGKGRNLAILLGALVVFAAGCAGGGGDYDRTCILDVTPPTVTAVVPLNNAVGVPVNTKITATFSEYMEPTTITGTTFTVVNTTLGGTAVAGDVTYDVTSRTAIFTPTTPTTLPENTLFTATITTEAEDLAGLALVSDFVWTFTTGGAPDATKPRVISTVPDDGATDVVLNTAITATFSEDMNPTTLAGTTNFTVVNTTLGGTAVAGDVTYDVASRTAIFTPTTPTTLPANTLFTATITTGAEDLAGNALAGNQAPLPAASNYIWTFTTGAAEDTINPFVTLTVPADGDTDVDVNATVNATFSEAMNPFTIGTASFTVQKSGSPLGPILIGTVAYDLLTHIATFTPTSPLDSLTEYTATITTDVEDLAGNALVSGPVPNPWVFTTGSGLAPDAIPLGRASTFGISAWSSITSTGPSTINGNVALNPGSSMTGFPPGVVNGTINVDNQVAMDVYTDLHSAYVAAKTLAPGITVPPGQDLGAWTPPGSVLPAGHLAPGTYTAGSTISINTPLTLDAGGNANAVWVFQIGSSLTTFVGSPGGNVVLIGGALAKNVFWVPTAAATIGTGTTFYGTILAGGSVTAETGSTIYGRILAGALGAGTVALQSTTVNVPAP